MAALTCHLRSGIGSPEQRRRRRPWATSRHMLCKSSYLRGQSESSFNILYRFTLSEALLNQKYMSEAREGENQGQDVPEQESEDHDLPEQEGEYHDLPEQEAAGEEENLSIQEEADDDGSRKQEDLDHNASVVTSETQSDQPWVPLPATVLSQMDKDGLAAYIRDGIAYLGSKHSSFHLSYSDSRHALESAGIIIKDHVPWKAMPKKLVQWAVRISCWPPGVRLAGEPTRRGLSSLPPSELLELACAVPRLTFQQIDVSDNANGNDLLSSGYHVLNSALQI